MSLPKRPFESSKVQALVIEQNLDFGRSGGLSELGARISMSNGWDKNDRRSNDKSDQRPKSQLRHISTLERGSIDLTGVVDN